MAERLPPFSVPSAVVIIDSIPLTASGELDERALPDVGEEPGPATSPGSRGGHRPRLLTLYEPANHLDGQTIGRVFTDLGHLWPAVPVVSHEVPTGIPNLVRIEEGWIVDLQTT